MMAIRAAFFHRYMQATTLQSFRVLLRIFPSFRTKNPGKGIENILGGATAALAPAGMVSEAKEAEAAMLLWELLPRRR